MTGTFRRIRLHAALMLLLSGLLQPLVAAEGVACARMHAPASAAQVDESAGETGSSVDGSQQDAVEHQHSPISTSETPGALTAPCGVADLVATTTLTAPIGTLRPLVQPGDAPATSHDRSLFRPPRLS